MAAAGITRRGIVKAAGFASIGFAAPSFLRGPVRAADGDVAICGTWE